MRRIGIVVAVLLAAVAGVAGGAGAVPDGDAGVMPGPRPIGTLNQLGMPGFFQLAVDDDHGRLFLSPGAQWTCDCPADQQVVVADFAGHVVARIGGLGGARGLALSPARDRLYVAVSEPVNAIAEVDTATLRVVAVRPTGPGLLDWIVLAGGRLWAHLVFPDGNGVGQGFLASWDPARPADPWVPSDVQLRNSLQLASAGEQSPYLAGTPYGTSDSGRWVYRVEGTQLREVATVEFQGGGYVDDLEVDPAGRFAVTMTNPPETVSRWTLPGLTDWTVLPYPTYGAAADFDAQGRWLVVGGFDITGPPPVRAYEVATGRTVDLGFANLGERGIGVTAGATKVFAVLTDPYNADPVLRVLNGPAAPGYRPPPRVPVR